MVPQCALPHRRENNKTCEEAIFGVKAERVKNEKHKHSIFIGIREQKNKNYSHDSLSA